MRNFLRALKFSWKFRRQLAMSLVFALLAAGIWGLCFTPIKPVLEMLNKRMGLHEWVDLKIATATEAVNTADKQIDSWREELQKAEALPPGAFRDREIHRVQGEIAAIQSEQSQASTSLWRHQQFKQHVVRFFPQDRFHTVVWLLVLVIFGIMLKGLFEFLQDWLVGRVTHNSIYDLRNKFYRVVIHQDLRQVHESGSAELMARFTNDMETIGNGMKLLYGRVVGEPLRILACVIVACWYSWQLTLLFMISVPLAIFLMTKASRMMKRASRRVLERMSKIYKLLQETFQGLRVVKAYTMEPYERRRFEEATRAHRNRAVRVSTIDAFASPMIEVLGVVAVVGALLAGAYLVLNNRMHLFGIRMCAQPMDPETLLALYAVLGGGIADPVRKLSSVYTKIQSGAAASERVFGIMDRVPQVQPNATGPRITQKPKTIEFRNVCFAYHPGQPVLENISVKVQPGEVIAIVGPNGCGKSTLLNLLPRFYDPDYGSIIIDDIDIRTAQLRSLRKQIGLVTQSTVLFADTIAKNIAYGSGAATQEQIEEAAKKAFAHEFIMTLPNGYATVVGEGRQLSGGEQQRIALARAILRNPSILLLDEFTSQIDAVSDALIHQALKEFMKGRTTILITHKMHTLEVADRIIVLNAGRMEAVGTHLELLQTSALYRSLQEAHAQLKVAG